MPRRFTSLENGGWCISEKRVIDEAIDAVGPECFWVELNESDQEACIGRGELK